MTALLSRGLLMKSIREAWVATLLFGVGFFVFQIVLTAVLPQFQESLAGQILEMPMFQVFFRILLGSDIGTDFGPTVIGAFAWVHPVILALAWALAIMSCTRLPVGEIDRSTVDILLGLPVSRWQAWRTDTVVWIGAGVVVLALGVLGAESGRLLIAPEQRPPILRMLGVILNFFCLYVAVGGLACFMSGCANRRGRAIGATFAVVVVSFFLSFLAGLWPPAQSISFLSLMSYYRPLEVVRGGGLPLGDMAVLLGVGAVGWTFGGLVFARRDILTI